MAEALTVTVSGEHASISVFVPHRQLGVWLERADGASRVRLADALAPQPGLPTRVPIAAPRDWQHVRAVICVESVDGRAPPLAARSNAFALAADKRVVRRRVRRARRSTSGDRARRTASLPLPRPATANAVSANAEKTLISLSETPLLH